MPFHLSGLNGPLLINTLTCPSGKYGDYGSYAGAGVAPPPPGVCFPFLTTWLRLSLTRRCRLPTHTGMYKMAACPGRMVANQVKIVWRLWCLQGMRDGVHRARNDGEGGRRSRGRPRSLQYTVPGRFDHVQIIFQSLIIVKTQESLERGDLTSYRRICCSGVPGALPARDPVWRLSWLRLSRLLLFPFSSLLFPATSTHHDHSSLCLVVYAPFCTLFSSSRGRARSGSPAAPPERSRCGSWRQKPTSDRALRSAGW